jgi:hypothetical protein
MATRNKIKKPRKKLSDEFSKVAFAEAGELHQEHPHKLRKMSDSFAEVAFAESGEPYPGDKKKETEADGPVCIKGQTKGGICT